MDSNYTDNSDSNIGTSSKLSETNTRKNKSLDDSNDSDSTVIKKAQQKSHEELRLERIDELNIEYQKYISDSEYEKAITIMKKMIFFEPSSNLKRFI